MRNRFLISSPGNLPTMYARLVLNNERKIIFQTSKNIVVPKNIMLVSLNGEIAVN